MDTVYWYLRILFEELESSLLWVVIGAVAAFALAFLLAKLLHHRILPAVLLVACIAAFLVARWATDHPGHAMLQAQAFIIGQGLLGAVFGAVGWLIFARQRWAMTTSAVATLVLILSLPFSVPIVACTAVAMCF